MVGKSSDVNYLVQQQVALKASQLATGRYIDIITEGMRALAAPMEDGHYNGVESANVFSFIHEKVTSYLWEGGDDATISKARGCNMLFLAAALLLTYQQSNYTGPTLDEAVMSKILPLFTFIAEK